MAALQLNRGESAHQRRGRGTRFVGSTNRMTHRHTPRSGQYGIANTLFTHSADHEQGQRGLRRGLADELQTRELRKILGVGRECRSNAYIARPVSDSLSQLV